MFSPFLTGGGFPSIPAPGGEGPHASPPPGSGFSRINLNLWRAVRLTVTRTGHRSAPGGRPNVLRSGSPDRFFDAFLQYEVHFLFPLTIPFL